MDNELDQVQALKLYRQGMRRALQQNLDSWAMIVRCPLCRWPMYQVGSSWLCRPRSRAASGRELAGPSQSGPCVRPPPIRRRSRSGKQRTRES